MNKAYLVAVALTLAALLGLSCQKTPKELERPERIVSIRQVMYDSVTYVKLAQLWKEYYDAFPSEDAYANWMYATNHVLSDNYGKEREDYNAMLKKGLDQYPSSPVLLYLLGREKQFRQNNLEGLQLLEKSAAMDPRYMDPLYQLVVAYLSQGDREKADVALRHLLDRGAVEDEVMDFCYNMIASVDSNAILITNGDNDTFPGWILTRIVRFRIDVNVVNRSLLNTDWYALSIVKEGVPHFITQAGLDSLRKSVSAEMVEARKKKIPYQDVPVTSDRLIVRIIEAAQRVGRPVYFACTAEPGKLLSTYAAQGRNLGLVTMVTSTSKSYQLQLRDLFRRWTMDFRTGGLDGWQLRFAKGSRSGRILTRNYATALFSLKDQIEAAGDDVQLSLFKWYRNHLLDLMPADIADKVNVMWCSKTGPREIQEWCKNQGIG
jgi:tetratricopeptide (TPR) repeat protein